MPPSKVRRESVMVPSLQYLVGLDVVLFDDRAPQRHLFGEEFGFFRRVAEAERNLQAFGQGFTHSWIAQAIAECCGKTLDDRFRRTGRRKYAPPRVRFKTGETGIDGGLGIRKVRQAG